MHSVLERNETDLCFDDITQLVKTGIVKIALWRPSAAKLPSYPSPLLTVFVGVEMPASYRTAKLRTTHRRRPCS